MGILDDEERRLQAKDEAARQEVAARVAAQRVAEEQRMTWTPESRELAAEFLRKVRERRIETNDTVYTVTVKRIQSWTSNPVRGPQQRWDESEVSRERFASCYKFGWEGDPFRVCAETGALIEKVPDRTISDRPPEPIKGGWFSKDTNSLWAQTVVRTWQRVPLTDVVVYDTAWSAAPHCPSWSLIKEMATFLRHNA